jgi:UDP-N-acetylmuramate--alanine ligase
MTHLVRPGSYHFIGIGGAGMSGLARLALADGARVSGSDQSPSPVLDGLAALGARVHVGHDPANLDGAGVVVVSSAVPADNPELAAARQGGMAVIHRAELLARLLARRRGIAVAGSHGKSTTTALIAMALLRTGCDPSVVVGGEVRELGSNARLGAGPYIVAEADESDGSFVRLRPWIAVVTNVDDDHLDHYRDRRDLLRAFVEFLAGVRPGGLGVLCWDDPWVRGLAGRCRRPILTYALDQPADLQGRDVAARGLRTRFRAAYRGADLGAFELGVPGRHNAQNALAALAVALHLGLDLAAVGGALAEFGGVGRRFEVLNPGGRVLVVDDYAHHPTEVRATLRAARAVAPGRILVMFQPHRYSRTRLLAEAFGGAFEDADELLLTEVYPAGEPPQPGVSAALIADAVRRHGRPAVTFCPALEDLVARAAALARPGDLVLSMGAGDVRRAGEELAKAVGR